MLASAPIGAPAAAISEALLAVASVTAERSAVPPRGTTLAGASGVGAEAADREAEGERVVDGLTVLRPCPYFAWRALSSERMSDAYLPRV